MLFLARRHEWRVFAFQEQLEKDGFIYEMRRKFGPILVEAWLIGRWLVQVRYL